MILRLDKRKPFENVTFKSNSAVSRCSHPTRRRCEQVLSVYAWARTAESRKWRLVLKFRDRDGRAHTILATPAQLREGAAFFNSLEERGFPIPTSSAQRERLKQELLTADPHRRVLLVDRSGWHAGSFLLGNKTLSLGSERL